MPYYDPYSGQEVETEEERKAREDAEKAAGTTPVSKKEIVTYEDGSQTHKTTQEVAAPIAPSGQGITAPANFGQRLGQAVAQIPENFTNNLNRGLQNLQQAPENFTRKVQAIPGQVQQRVERAISPDETFNRMMQVESGGRQYNPQGQVLTSNKGAMGIAQVMPTTAMDPGYGVPNIFDLAQQRGIPFQNRDRATAEQLLANRALNQEFGANYYNAMKNRFDGGPGAVAAYNAGPGRVSQNMAQNQGQLNIAQLPQETQGYLQKVGMPAQPVKPGVPGLTPVAEMPTQAPNTYDEFGTPIFSQAQANLDTQINRYQSIQDKPDELMKFAFDTNTPDWLKQRAKDQIVETYSQQKNLAEAEKQASNLTPKQVAQIMTKRSEGNSVGDWLQYLLFKHVGLTDLANQKGEQLGIGHQWTRSNIIDETGNTIPVEIQTTASGKVLGGNMLDGTPLTSAQLNQTAGTLGKGTSVSAEVYVDTKTGNRYRSGVDSQGNSALINIQGGAPFRGNAKDLQVQSIGTAAAKAEATNAVELRYTGPKAYTKAGASFAGDFNAKNGTNIGYATETPGAPLIDKNTGQTIVPDNNGNITATKVGGGAVTGQAPQAQVQSTTEAATIPLDKLPKAPTMNPGESPAAFAARTKAWSDTYGKQYASLEKNTKAAKDLFPYVTQMKSLIDKSTSSGFGSIVDSAGNFVGYSTPGAEAIAAIAPLASKVLMGVERFEGPQSDKDVAAYKEAAGRLADPTIPAAQKQAAFNTIIDIMKRNAPDLNWDSVSGQNAGGIKIIKREKI